ncbi:UDP-N-acetylmuramoyl-tripeptide--D-alanyl-D-alanine ligase [Clostridiaceae bacterium HSG29]|nr:UDP-N-acetylmuramoyl-tripeptide--D-alanyl-D-alanine ligase [Clostridiaceae bacterium HSG29]
MNIKIKEIIELLDCKIKNIDIDDKEAINQISTDTREIEKGSVFLALIGEKFNGHDFIEKAIDNGAKYIISEVQVDYPCIIVKDSKEAYLKIAEFYREKINPIVVAVTGSVGKTTTKEFISNVLKNKYNVLTTYKNFNNEIGVSKTILGLKETDEVLVIELGMDHAGEMRVLSKIVKPDYVILTNIGISHVGNFNSKDDIVKAKFEIFEYIKKDGLVIYNGDDETLNKNILKVENKTLKFGYKKENDIITTSFISKGIYGTKINVITSKNKYVFDTTAIGNHLGYSILPAVLMGELLNLSSDEIKNGIESYKYTDKRMALVKINDITVINDTYNASLESMKSALDTLEDTPLNVKKIAFLSDILELGNMSKEIHEELGLYAINKKIDKVIFVGKEVKYSYLKAKEENFTDLNYFSSKEELKKEFKDLIEKDAIILLKGSRGTKMEELLDYLKEL